MKSAQPLNENKIKTAAMMFIKTFIKLYCLSLCLFNVKMCSKPKCCALRQLAGAHSVVVENIDVSIFLGFN